MLLAIYRRIFHLNWRNAANIPGNQRRSQVLLQRLNQRSQRPVGGNGSWRTMLAGAATTALLMNHSQAEAEKSVPKKAPKMKTVPLEFKETVDYLKQKIAPIRESLTKRGHVAPFLTINEEVSGSKGPSSVRITIAVSSLRGLGAWMALLDAPIYLMASYKPSSTKGENVDACEFTDEANGTSVYMESYPQPHLTIRKNIGFSKDNLDAILHSYEGICLSNQNISDNNTHSGSENFRLVPFLEMLENVKKFEDKSLQHGQNGELVEDNINSTDKCIAELNKFGIKVFVPNDNAELQWQQLAGYTSVKNEISDTILNYLKYPDFYDSIVRGTRERFESNRPRAMLFEGPPGTGKTMSARIIAGACSMYMIHLPVESIVSKWYGESEKSFKKILNLCEKLGGCVIFIDEIDAMAPTRGGEIHEATRRILSVLLQRLEGFDGRSRNILVCATNRKEDLDKALISRFNVIIKFDLPDTQTRAAIFKMYAKQLSFEACSDLSELSNGISCRGIKDVCEHTERKHASAMIGKLILGRNIQNIYDIASSVPLPKHKDYAEQVTQYQISHEKYNCEKGKYRT